MRLVKTSGGLPHGRGITYNVLKKWDHAMPKCIPICDALEEFTGVHSHTSDQHVDLRTASAARDRKDYDTFRTWLDVHSLFAYGAYDSFVNIATGFVADSEVNADEASVVGSAATLSITVVPYAEVKLKRSYRMVTISGSKSKTSVRGTDVEIKSTILFLHTTCVIKDTSEMDEYLKHEFSGQPPSLFEKGLMRKTAKSSRANLLKSKVNVLLTIPAEAYFVLDGGNLLHSVAWPQGATYSDVWKTTASHVCENFGTDTTVVYDGYCSPQRMNIFDEPLNICRQIFCLNEI